MLTYELHVLRICDHRTGTPFCSFHAQGAQRSAQTGLAFVIALVSATATMGGNGIAVDSSGNVMLSALPTSTELCREAGPSGKRWVPKPICAAITRADGLRIAVRIEKKAYVTGTTSSTTFTTKNPLSQQTPVGMTAFVSKIDTRIVTTNTSHVFSKYYLPFVVFFSDQGQTCDLQAVVGSSSGTPRMER